uniref:Uncharacterized protein n=1 Tax=viral metagenome TaxID=1070528 RepID=A0A6C0HL38_9ZZZZ
MVTKTSKSSKSSKGKNSIKSESICGPDLSKLKGIPKVEKAKYKLLADLRDGCLNYEKCSKSKCDYIDMDLKNELVKQDIHKVMTTVEKCIKNKDRIKCALDKYAKLSPKLKIITGKVKTCKQETCKDESDKMIALANNMVKNATIKHEVTKHMKLLKKIGKSKSMKKMFLKIMKTKTKTKTKSK